MQVGFGLHFWLNIVLTLLGWIPGIIHAIYITVKVGPKREIRAYRCGCPPALVVDLYATILLLPPKS